MSIRITITNNKGGVAKTTTVVNTATALALVGFRVLVVDTDPQGNATMHFGCRETAINSNKHLVTAIKENFAINELIIPSNVEGVSLLASHPSLREIPTKYANYKIQFELFRKSMGTPDNDLISNYDFVLFDTNPSLNSLLASALDISHYYLIPIFSEIEPIIGLVELREWLAITVMSTARKVSMLGILITNYDKNNSTHRQMKDYLTSIVSEDTRIFDAIIPSSNSVKAAALNATPLMELRNGTSPAAIGYSKFVAELLNVLSTDKEFTGQETKERSVDMHVPSTQSAISA